MGKPSRGEPCGLAGDALLSASGAGRAGGIMAGSTMML